MTDLATTPGAGGAEEPLADADAPDAGDDAVHQTDAQDAGQASGDLGEDSDPSDESADAAGDPEIVDADEADTVSEGPEDGDVPADDSEPEVPAQEDTAPDHSDPVLEDEDVPVDDSEPAAEETTLDDPEPAAEYDGAAEPDADVATAADAEAPSLDEAAVAAGADAETAELEPAALVAPAAEQGTVTAAPPDGPPAYAWAPAAPKPRRNRRPVWIGIAASVAAVGLIASSLVLIAPGTSVAGVGVGGLTPGGAAGALQQRLDQTTIVLAGDGGDVVVTGADLGATVDAQKLADEAFGSHPMWNPTKWFSAPLDATIQIDAAAATAALKEAAPDLYRVPVDATLAYDSASAMYVTTAGEPGQGVDVPDVQAALQKAYDSGKSRVKVDTVLSPIEPVTTTAIAEQAAKSLNGILGTAGFYVGKERTVPVARATAASWLTVTHEPTGSFDIAADAAAIQKVVDTLPKAIDRKLVNATVITDTSGKVLKSLATGVSGRTLGDTSGIAASYATQLTNGNGVYVLPVTEKAFTTTKLARSIEVNISSQHAYLFENGKVVYSYPISSGLYGHDTNLGHFRIYAKVALQNMGDRELIKADYFTPNVPWISYFNGDEALHGAYWHNNFGHRMSHGCVNMQIAAAKLVYTWAPIGTPVWVHL